MEAEVQEIREHLRRFPPFDRLESAWLDRIAASVEVAYYRDGTSIQAYGEPIDSLRYVRSGAVEVYRHNGELYNRLSEGDIFGQAGLLHKQRVRFPAKAIEDTLLYLIPAEVFDRLCQEDDHFADFVELSGPRLKATVEQNERENDMMVTRVRRLVSRSPVLIEQTGLVRDAARLMTEQQVSAILLTERSSIEDDRAFVGEDGSHWRVAGILTDHDFRVRVLAAGGSGDTRLDQIKHAQVIAIQADESVYEAMLAMLRNNVHHLPVLQRRRPIGVVHLSDIVRYETHSSLYLVSNIFSQGSVKGLVRLMPDVRAAFLRLVDEGATSQMVGEAMSSIGRSLIRRLIELAEQELGP
ncbi:MAG TPA: CBS domain-containing protein, partial [Chromatiales bacterium]|nr:CBS domain-containing protein [Chromatiales bacterium]